MHFIPNICFVSTNYNNSYYTETLVKSISHQFIKATNINVIIVDNCSNHEDQENLFNIANKYPFVKIILNNENIGYFKGLNVGLKYIEESHFNPNFIIVGNNDLEFPNTFIEQLMNCKDIFNYYPVISPNIITFYLCFSKIF